MSGVELSVETSRAAAETDQNHPVRSNVSSRPVIPGKRCSGKGDRRVFYALVLVDHPR